MKTTKSKTSAIPGKVAPGICRTIIPASYDPTNQRGLNDWRLHIFYENYSHLANSFVRAAKRLLNQKKSC